MKYLIIISALLMAGCVSEPDKKHDQVKGEVRYEVFLKCMELAAKMPRQADDDVSDIVSECSSQAMYIANGLMPYNQYRPVKESAQ
jgi:outer membrane murein-binding lipoprotein Lpp